MIRLLHLFPSLLNLYGERANLLVLSEAIQRMGYETKIILCEDPSQIDLSAFDFIYAGAGTESKIEIAANKLFPVANKIKSLSIQGTPILFTGSACELLCKNICKKDCNILGIGLFDAIVNRTNDRQTGDVIYATGFDERPLVGFINKSGLIQTQETMFFKSVFGPGSNSTTDKIHTEGLKKNNTLATYLTGPILVKNNWVKNNLAIDIIKRYTPKANIAQYSDDYAEKGWEVTVSELTLRKSNEK